MRYLTLAEAVTAMRCVTRVYSTLGVFQPAGSHFGCVDLALLRVDFESVRALTDAEVTFTNTVSE